MKKHSRYAEEVLIAIRRIIRSVDLHSRELLRTFGLTSPQLVVLNALVSHPDQTVSHLAAKVSLSQGTVTTILDRLEKRELIARVRDKDDRRKTLVKATAEGERIAKAHPPLMQERFVERFGKLEEWEQTLLLSSLGRIVAMMESGDQVVDSAPLLISGPLSASLEETQAYLEEASPKKEEKG